MRTIRPLGFAVGLAWAAWGCRTTSDAPLSNVTADEVSGASLQTTSAPKQCAALRGNGTQIWAHFGAMARLLETQGLVDAAAGGSSASITAFLYESMLANPAIFQGCKAGSCTRQEVADRAAFLMKTLPYWLATAAESPEGRALAHVMTVSRQLGQFRLDRLDAAAVGDLQRALSDLQTLLASPAVRGLVNGDFLQFISPQGVNDPALLKFRAAEAKKAVQNFGQFEADSADILFRPGLFDFQGITRLIGTIGDLYAGRNPAVSSDWPDLYATCADAARGKSPWEIAPTACGVKFRAHVERFLAQRAQIRQPRIYDPVGAYLPALVTTATLVAHADLFEAARQRYLSGRAIDLNLPLDAVAFGYTGSVATLSGVQTRMRFHQDARSQRFLSLGPLRWSDILAVSPAEPGLTNARPFHDAAGRAYTSFGGWSDLSPTLALEGVGCQKIIYVTRQGGDSKFAVGVAKLVGLGPIQELLFSLERPDSSFVKAVNRADAVYCTNWDAISARSTQGIQALFQHAYQEGVLYTGDRAGAPVGCRKGP